MLLQLFITGQTCAQAGLDNGCCNFDDFSGPSGCYVPGGNCFCDEDCLLMQDCCSDVDTTRQCSNGTMIVYDLHDCISTLPASVVLSFRSLQSVS